MRRILYAFQIGFWIAAGIGFLLLATAGQAQIAPQRTAEIRRALKLHGYHGEMYSELKTIAKENGFQTQSVPDSRVLILIGLGPNYRRLLNPESAMTFLTEERKSDTVVMKGK
jgi:hypothetical protein